MCERPRKLTPINSPPRVIILRSATTSVRSAGGFHPFGRPFENRLRRRMDDVADARRKRRVAGGVVAMVRADGDVFDGLGRHLRDRVDRGLSSSAGLPWPSATNTPSSVTTNMLVVVNFSSPAWKSS